jgi:predicted Zn-dependent protease with MMP-like domain
VAFARFCFFVQYFDKLPKEVRQATKSIVCALKENKTEKSL